MSNDSASDESAQSEIVRKNRLVRQIPLLVNLMKQQLCSEGELARSLVIATFDDGDYIYYQGQPERDLLFIETGKVLITQRRRCRAMSTIRTGPITMSSSSSVIIARRPTRRRSQVEAEMEIQLHKHEEFEYFGEETLLQGMASRVLNAVASGAVTCFVLPEVVFAKLLAPVHDIMLYRHLLRMHSVVAKQRIFQHFSARQRQYLADNCTLERYEDGARIIQQGDKDDDRYFILVEGEADIVLDEPLEDIEWPEGEAETRYELDENGEAVNGGVRTSIVGHKTLYQGFGEMGILCRPRTTHVVAVGDVVCVAISRKTYIGASQLPGVSSLDSDAEALLAMSLSEEWALVVRTRNLHLANPAVSHYLETFVKKFKAAYMQKFEGKTLYLDLLRRMHSDPTLADEFPFVSDRVTWDSPTSSLSIVRAETRRILSLPPAERSPFEISFIGRLLESTGFINKFDRPGHVDKLTLARGLARFANFCTIQKEKYLFRQGKIESRAFLILRGNISIVNEDISAVQTGVAVKHYDVLVTLGAGDSFGELSLVTRLQRSATALAACEADLLVFERAHLHALAALQPGVSVQHAMVERAEFLATLSFFRDSDFAQCIRVAHDVQEQFYEPRHIFLQEPVHLRTLYIVKSGEVVVFLRRNVPITESTTAGTNEQAPTKEVLVRVATIGPQEFFGVAIASANIIASPTSTTPASSGYATASPATNAAAGSSPSSPAPVLPTSPASSTPAAKAQLYIAAAFAAATAGIGAISRPSTNYDLSTTVFMCSTRVQMLELSERGWRRLAMSNLQSICNSLLERHRWNLEAVEKQQQQGNRAYFHVDKPWQAASLTRAAAATDNKDSQTRVLEPLPSTQLARRLHDKKQQRHLQQHSRHSPIGRLFCPGPRAQSKQAHEQLRPSACDTALDRPTIPMTPRSPTHNLVQERTLSPRSPICSPVNLSSPAHSSPFLSPRSAQLAGSFPSNGLSSPSSNTCQAVQNFFSSMPRSPTLADSTSMGFATLSPRPPSQIMATTGFTSPRQTIVQRRMSTDSKQDAVRQTQATNSESDCKAMWKLQRRPSAMKP